MKNQLAVLAMGILATQAVFLAPTTAQTEGKFYCGQAYDIIGRKNVPATLMSSPNREKPIVVILWKSEYFGQEFNPNQRCQKVSPKFQAAYVGGNFEYLKVGYERKLPIVCAVKTENEPCTNAGMLFTLKPFGNTQSQLNTLMGNIEGAEAGPDIYQSSGRRKGREGIVNIRKFLRAAK
jgi:Circadian oscillating protein COP23